MHMLVVSRGRNSGSIFRARLLRQWVVYEALSSLAGFPQEDSTGAFASVMTAAPLLLCYGDEMCNAPTRMAFCIGSVMRRSPSALSISTFSYVKTIFLRVTHLAGICTGTLDMSRSLLALEAAVLTLRDWSALVGYNNEFSTSMATSADAMSYKTRPTCPLAAVFLQDHVLEEQAR